MPVRFVLNGEERIVDPAPEESALDVLRTHCGIRSPKDGCQPQGQCGCCLVLLDGMPRTVCATPAAKLEGRKVLTLEGLPEEERTLLAECFTRTVAHQCGFCIPGIALRAKALTDANPSPSRADIRKALHAHLCRCTGYTKIVEAIELVAAVRRGEALPAPANGRGGVGERVPRTAGRADVLGERAYVADLDFPGMLHAVPVLSAHARALVRAVDASRAAAAPGVVRVLTADDVPGNRWYGLILADWPGFVAPGEEARCVGDVLAIVAAETRAQARAAARLVDVDYEVRPPVLSPEDAIAPGAPVVNPVHPNLLSETVYRRGDADAALALSAHVVRGTWRTQRIEHLYLEPEAAVCVPRPDGRLHLYSQGQGVFDDRRQVASFLGVDEDRVFVELVPNGGAFGGKEDMSVQAHAALLAHLTGRPAMVTLTREESIRLHPKRHPITMEYAVGCDGDGRLTGVKARMIGDSGAYASVGMKVLERAAGHACGPYRVAAIDVTAVAAYTNNPPCGAMRGFGVNQTSFAIEGCLDLLAEKAGLSGWEIRWRNALQVGDTVTTGQVLEKSVGIRRTLEAVRPHYEAARAAGRAVGVACGLKNSGIGNGVSEWGKARLVPEGDGTVTIYNGYTEMGQGLFTVLTQFAAEVTGLPASVFRPRVDATFALGCGQTTGSRATLFAGRAVTSAAGKLKAALDGGATLDSLRGQVFAADVVIDDTTAPGETRDGRVKTHTSYGFATQVCVLDETGRVERVIAAHDVGRVVNPATCEGQIEGSIHMGLGYALTEELACPNGMPDTFKLRDLGVLRAADMPDVEVLLIEEPEPEGPFGAKGVGEIGLVPTAGAVAGALAAFDGRRRTELPMRDSPAAAAMGVGRRRRK